MPVSILRNLLAPWWAAQLLTGARSFRDNPLIGSPRLNRHGLHAARVTIAARLAEHFGDESLSDREIEVLSHVAGGNRNRDIGKLLFIAEETVKVHLKRILDKLGASDRTEAVAIAARRGIINL